MVKKDTFKNKAILTELNKRYPQENIKSVVDFKEKGYDNGCAISIVVSDKEYYYCDYMDKSADFLTKAEEMISELKMGLKDIKEKKELNKKFLLDQLLMTHITNQEIMKYDEEKYEARSTMGVLNAMITEYKNPETILNKIQDLKRAL